MSSDDKPDEFVTPTGWRIKGGLASSLSERAFPLHPVEEAVWGGTFRIHSRGKQDALSLVREALEAWLSDVHDTAVDLSKELVIEGRERSGLYWSPSEGGGLLLVRHPHPAFERKLCVTDLQVTTLAGKTTIRIRVGPQDGPLSISGRVGVGQIVPPWMVGLMNRAHYMYEGGGSTVLDLTDREIPGFVERQLLNPRRAFPLAVLSPEEEGGYVIEASELARELLGIAHLYRIVDHQHTFTLSDTIGNRHLSSFFGALRIYLPGFSRSHETYQHPLLLKERLSDPLMRASEFGGVLLGRTPIEIDIPPPKPYRRVRDQAVADAAARAERQDAEGGLDAGVDTAGDLSSGLPGDGASAGTDVPDSSSTGAPAIVPGPGSVLPQRFLDMIESQHSLLSQLRNEIRAQGEKLESVEGTVRDVHGELEQMQTRMEMGEGDIDHIARQLDRANSYLRSLLPEKTVEEADLTEGAQSEEKPESDELLQIVRAARETYPEYLRILDSAEAAARESDFHDPARVETILGAMADISRQRQEGSLGRNLKAAFRAYGLTYQSSISKGSPERIRRQHDFTDEQGQVHFCEEHISVGNAYDTRFCLRVYFTSKSPREPRFVVGHVGRHLDTMSTS